MEDAFEGKYTAVMTTSIHFYDHTAHNYMRAICEDLGMKYVDAISLDIVDLMKEERRQEMVIFAEGFFKAVQEQAATSKLFKPLIFSDFAYQPSEAIMRVDPKGKKILVLTDTIRQQYQSGKDDPAI